MSRSTLFFLLTVVYMFQHFCESKGNYCRNMYFKEPISNKNLIGHVIANITVKDKKQCEIQCYLNPDCISLNYDTTELAKPNCQLSSSDEGVSPGNLVEKTGIIYQAFENHCIGVTCPISNMTCQSGFDPLSYRCACPKCYQGNHCNDLLVIDDIVLVFPEKSVTQVVAMEKRFPTPLTSLTISLWAQFKLKTPQHYLFSYATRSYANEILLGISDSTTVYFGMLNIIYGKYITFSEPIRDSTWYHFAVTWKSSSGQINFFKNGHLVYSSFMATGRSVSQEGALVLGQDQDSYFGGYQAAQSFQGNLTRVNLWDKVLTDYEITKLAKKCPSGEGNLIKWKDAVPYRNGNVLYACGPSCFV